MAADRSTHSRHTPPPPGRNIAVLGIGWPLHGASLAGIRACGQPIHILHRFCIVAKMNTALDQVCAGEAHQLARDGYEPVLKKTGWCVLKRRANLTGQQWFRLRDLLRYNLRTVRAIC
jgi:hypothetical protein